MDEEKNKVRVCPMCGSEMFEREDGSWKCSRCYWWMESDAPKEKPVKESEAF